MERPLQLGTDVRTFDGRLLLAAGTALTADIIGELASSGSAERWPAVPMLRHGTIHADTLRQMGQGPYRRLFGDEERRRLVFELEEAVRLPLPLLEGLGYFVAHDFYTYRHILMVFALSCYLARQVLSETRDLQLEANAGPLHDVGKVCLPPTVLRKSDPLARTERRLLEEHTVAGFVLLAYYLGDPSSFAARVARDHHERRDGSGYPRGMALDDTLVEIVSACDVYDALISPRPYRRGNYDNRTALEEITRQAEKGMVRWEIVRHLVAVNREGCRDPDTVTVSLEKRGEPPAENNYGLIIEDEETE